MGASTSTQAEAQPAAAEGRELAEEVAPSAPPPEASVSAHGGGEVAGGQREESEEGAGAGGGDTAYAELLVQARGEDFRDLEELKFLQVGGQDKKGRTVVTVVGRFLPCSVIDVERLRRFIYREMDPVVAQGDFTLLYVHSGTSWKESPGVFWLRDMYLKLPTPYHDRLQSLLVLHPGLAVWAASWVFGPQWTPGWVWRGLGDLFWKKLEWVTRVEFLWELVPPRAVQLPEFVAEHDVVLEDAPLIDYGVAPTTARGGYGGLASMPSTMGGAPPVM